MLKIRLSIACSPLSGFCIRAGGTTLRFPSGEELSVPEGLRQLPDADAEAILFVRPEHLHIHSPTAGAQPPGLRGRVRTILYLGTQVRYFLDLFEEPEAETSPKEVLVDEKRRIPGVREGTAVTVDLQWDGARLFPAQQREQLAAE